MPARQTSIPFPIRLIQGMKQVIDKYLALSGFTSGIRTSFLFRLLGIGAVYLNQVLLARLMGPRGFGDYSVIITIINFLIALCLLGFDSSVVRMVPSLAESKSYGALHGFVRFAYRLVITASIICSVGLFLYLLANARKFSVSFSEGVFWGVILIPFLALIYQSSAVLRSLNRIKGSFISVYFLIPLFLSAGCMYYFREHGKLTVDAVMFILLVCVIGISIYVYRRSGRLLRSAFPAAEPELKAAAWLKISGSLVLLTALNLLLRQSDIFFVSLYLGNAKAGIYAAAEKIAMLVSLGLGLTEVMYFPKIAAYFERREKKKMSESIRSASRQVFFLAIPACIIVIAAGKALLMFFGPAFVNSYYALIVLALGQVIAAAIGLATGIMSILGHRRTILIYSLLVVALQICLNILLIPRFGIIAAASITSFCTILLNLLSFFFLRKKTGISVSA